MQDVQPVVVVQAWQTAVNSQDIDQLLALSAPNIEIVGPRGSGYGHQLLREWLNRAGLRLETLRVFGRDNVIVVAQHGVWHVAETGATSGEQNLASLFRVTAGQIVQFARYDSLDDALEAANLTYADEIVRHEHESG